MISLDVAKQLRAVGWEKETQFVWILENSMVCRGYCITDNHEAYTGEPPEKKFSEPMLICIQEREAQMYKGAVGVGEYGDDNQEHYLDWIYAPSCEELLDVLPKGTLLKRGLATGLFLASSFEEFDESTPPNERWSKNPADALGLLLLALIKEGIVKV